MNYVLMLWTAVAVAPGPAALDCGPQAVATLAALHLRPDVGQVTTGAGRWSMADLVQSLVTSGLPVVAVRATLPELLARDQACIVHLRDPDHWCVLVDGDDHLVRVARPGARTAQILARGMVDRLYTGYAVILDCPVTDAGRVAVDQPHQTMPPGPAGDGATAVFGLRNTGRKALHVRLAGTSCGCASAQLEGATIPPGGEGRLTVVLRDRNAVSFTHYARLETDDPQRPVVLLSVGNELPSETPDWVRPGTVWPQHLSFVACGALPCARYAVVSGPAGFRVLNATATPWCLEAVVAESQPTPDGGVAVRLRLVPVGGISASTAGRLSIDTNSSTSPRIEVPFTVRYQPALTAVPGAISLGAVAVGETATRRVQLAVCDAVARRLVSVSADDGDVTPTIADGGPGTTLAVQILIKPSRPGRFLHEVRALADSGETVTIQVAGNAYK